MKYLIAFLILAVSVSACEETESINAANCPYCETSLDWPDWADSAHYDTLTGWITFYKPNFFNPAREYMRVDTVGWWIISECDSVHIRLPFDVVEGETLADGWKKTPIIDTTWHPKVQVWLIPGEMRILECVLGEGHDWRPVGIWVTGHGPKCSKCGKRRDRR